MILRKKNNRQLATIFAAAEMLIDETFTRLTESKNPQDRVHEEN